MSSNQDLDKTESATPHKLEQAKDRGNVAKSADIVGTAVLVFSTVYVSWQGVKAIEQVFGLGQTLMNMAGRIGGGQELWSLTAWATKASTAILAPFLAMIILVVILANWVQTGPLLSTEAIKPDAQRLNPMNVLRKLFSLRSIYDAVKSTFKLTVLLAVGAYVLHGIFASNLSGAVLEPAGQLKYMIDTTVNLMTYLCIALVVFASIDLIYTRREFAKQMRMSKRELTDEHKNREGDPRIRMRLRELRQQMLQRTAALRQVKSADVVITNPTHFAIALKYDEQIMDAPQLVAKGAGLVALAMRRIASKHRIPVIENPILARALYRRSEVSDGIPQDMYAQVAKILVWVLALRKAQMHGGS